MFVPMNYLVVTAILEMMMALICIAVDLVLMSRRGVVDEEGEEDAHEQGGQFHHPPHILLPLSPSLHCAAFRGALAVGRPLWPQLLATPFRLSRLSCIVSLLVPQRHWSLIF